MGRNDVEIVLFCGIHLGELRLARLEFEDYREPPRTLNRRFISKPGLKCSLPLAMPRYYSFTGSLSDTCDPPPFDILDCRN